MNLRRDTLQFFGFVAFMLLFVQGCGEKTTILQSKSTQIFTQDYNPLYLDILWVVDDRSQMFLKRPDLAEQAKSFFAKLDGSTSSYRMGFITADMLKAKGQLQPLGKPLVLEKNIGTVQERTELFSSSVLKPNPINIRTDGENKSFEAAQIALTSTFIPRAHVPLVLVFISDSDDHSASPVDGGNSVVDAYANQFKAIKGNNPNLLRVYSINYVKLAAGAIADTTNRCATLYNADIDSTRTNTDGSSYFEDRFFKLANKLSGETADLCGQFSSRISLNGLRLKELSRRFSLEKKAQSNTLDVVVFYKGSGQKVDAGSWRFEEATNEVVFDVPPPEGTNIQITYLGA